MCSVVVVVAPGWQLARVARLSLRVIVSNIFLAIWDAALKIMVLMSLTLHGIKVGREAELMRS